MYVKPVREIKICYSLLPVVYASARVKEQVNLIINHVEQNSITGL